MQKICSNATDVTQCGNSFQTRAVATTKARLLIVATVYDERSVMMIMMLKVGGPNEEVILACITVSRVEKPN